MRPIMSDRRGDLNSVIVMIVIVFALSISAVIFWKVFTEFTEEFKKNPRVKDNNNTIDVIETVEEKGQGLLDLVVFISLVGFMIGIIVSAVYLPSHPVVTGIFIVGMLVAIFLSGMFVNVYEEVTEQPQLSSTASGFTMTGLILGDYFPIIMTFLLMIVTIILFGKSRNSGVQV